MVTGIVLLTVNVCIPVLFIFPTESFAYIIQPMFFPLVENTYFVMLLQLPRVAVVFIHAPESFQLKMYLSSPAEPMSFHNA